MVLPRRQQFLLNPGPVNLHGLIRENLFNLELCHRQPEFERLLAHVKSRLFSLAEIVPGKFNLSLMHGSGTFAVDAGLTSLVRGRVLVINNGVYCERMSKTLALLPDVELFEFYAGLGKAPDLEQLESQLQAADPHWIAMVHHETTTGLLNPLDEVAEIAQKHGCLLFVDAVSSFGVHPVSTKSHVICFNSNKCLESLPGVAGVFWKSNLEVHSTTPVLDVSLYHEDIPSTPNVQAIIALDIALDILSAEDRSGRYRRLASHIWQVGGQYFPLLLPEEGRSHVLTAFKLNRRDPDELLNRALEEGFVIYPGQRSLRNEIFRVANMGSRVDEAAIDKLFSILSTSR